MHLLLCNREPSLFSHQVCIFIHQQIIAVRLGKFLFEQLLAKFALKAKLIIICRKWKNMKLINSFMFNVSYFTANLMFELIISPFQFLWNYVVFFFSLYRIHIVSSCSRRYGMRVFRVESNEVLCGITSFVCFWFSSGQYSLYAIFWYSINSKSSLMLSDVFRRRYSEVISIEERIRLTFTTWSQKLGTFFHLKEFKNIHNRI